MTQEPGNGGVEMPAGVADPALVPPKMAQINQPGFTENRAQVRESPTTLNIIPGCARSDPIDSRNLFLWRAAVMDLSPDSGDNLTGHSFLGRRVGIRF